VLTGVVGHINRGDAAKNLCRAAQGGVVSLDDGSMGCEANHLAVLAWLKESAQQADELHAQWSKDGDWKPGLIDSTWFVVLEDDAQLVPDFPQHLEAALACAPSPLVGLYMGSGNPSGAVQRTLLPAIKEAQRLGRAWLEADWFISAVGYAVQRYLVDDLLDYVEDRADEWPLRITRWAQERDIATSYTCPSLVNHADGQSMISPTRKVGQLKRRAHTWGVPGRWDTPAIAIRSDNCPPWSRLG
jgi:hypothetical protein